MSTNTSVPVMVRARSSATVIFGYLAFIVINISLRQVSAEQERACPRLIRVTVIKDLLTVATSFSVIKIFRAIGDSIITGRR